MRLCAAIDGFRQRYGHWPTTVFVDRVIYQDLKWMFSGETFQALNDRVNLQIRRGAMIAAEDSQGHVYDYDREGFPRERPHPGANEWLGVCPDV